LGVNLTKVTLVSPSKTVGNKQTWGNSFTFNLFLHPSVCSFGHNKQHKYKCKSCNI